MASLTKFLNNTRSQIDKLEYGGVPRPYLGMSGIGFHCMRSIWLSFHWADTSKYTARTERIFNLGHLFEPMIIKQIKDAGMEVYKMIPDTEQNREENLEYELVDGQLKLPHHGHQEEKQEEYIGYAKHAMGHSDGRIKGLIEAPEIEHLLEIKTMKEIYFKELCKVGIKKGHSTYYGQAQRYMRATGLEWAFFIVINKNTSHIYVERIKYNDADAQDLVRKETVIIMSNLVPENPYSKNYYKCDMCFQKEVCKGRIPISKNCRSCIHCDIENEGKWSCSYKDGKILSVEEQRNGCGKYKLGWGLENL